MYIWPFEVDLGQNCFKIYYADNPAFCKEMANKVEYWYFVEYAEIPTKSTIRTNQKITIK